MKKYFLTLALVLISTVSNAQNEVFKSFAQNFGKSAAFAYANISNKPVLLVSHEVFGNDENEELEALATSIFALDSDGKIVTLGSIRSQGTLYPVSILDNKLMVAGHHFVSVYGIRGEGEPELEMVCHEESDMNNHSKELKALFEKFEQAKPVKFTHLLNK
ncbi:MAG: hypothetical protein HUK06_03725 [Bacteroidaceae bacterium]|nr:hypothetical protein [Bacteroidaceae bacterium]